MRRWIIITLLIFVNISLPWAQQYRGFKVVVETKDGNVIPFYKESYALVVGVSDYTNGWINLPNAVRDANEVGDKLEQLGFNVTRVMNPGSDELRNAFDDMIYKMGGPDDRLIFFYAGHGETITMENKTAEGYIVPADAPTKEANERLFKRKAIGMFEISQNAKSVKVNHALYIFDSCFSGAIFSRLRSAVPEAIKNSMAHRTRQFVTAGDKDEAVPDKSVFKQCLILALDGDADASNDGYITGSELGNYLYENVINYSQGRQHPQYGKLYDPELGRGDFIFKLKKIIPSFKPFEIKKYALNVAANIEGATILLDNEELGVTPCIITTTEGKHTLELRHLKYFPYRADIDFSASMAKSLNFTLNRRAGLGKLKVFSDMQGTVIIDDVLSGVTGQLLDYIRTGNRHIVIRLPIKAYGEIDTTIVIRENQINELAVNFKKNIGSESKKVRIIDWNIMSEPSGATVKINDTIVGTTPVMVKRESGEVKLEISHEGYITFSEKVSVIRQFHRTLVPHDTYLEVSCSPGSGMIYIDGESFGVVTSTLKSFKLKTGVHTVRIAPVMRAYMESEFEIRLAPGIKKTRQIIFLPRSK